MVDPANPLRWCWCWWWRWHGWRWWGWCKGRNGQTSRTFFLSTPFFVDKVLCGKFSIHWTFSFLWLVVVFDGNVLDMKALFGHICSLMSIKRGRDREICQKLQNHNPWLLTSGRLWLSLEIKHWFWSKTQEEQILDRSLDMGPCVWGWASIKDVVDPLWNTLLLKPLLDSMIPSGGLEEDLVSLLVKGWRQTPRQACAISVVQAVCRSVVVTMKTVQVPNSVV